MRQSVETQLKRNKQTLAALKREGYKIGPLRYKSVVRMVELKQYGTTYRIKGNRVRLQNLSGWYIVRGIKQLDGWELANARLLKKADGYYLAVTAFKDKKSSARTIVPGSAIGLDLGLKTNITLSSGTEINASVEETDRLKRLQRKLSRQIKGSNSRAKTQVLIQKEYQRVNNKKNDLANKTVSHILKNETVFIQDEQINEWKKKKNLKFGGRTAQHSILGRVKRSLTQSDQVVKLHKMLATSQYCVCGAKNKHQLNQRIYFCGQCGYTAPRDVHAAMNMVWLGQDRLPAERRDFKPMERESDWRANLLAFQLRAANSEAVNSSLQLTIKPAVAS